VLPTTAEVYAVLHRVHHNWGENANVSDYIETPKPDGYRGIHIIHKRAGRLIEVQLRTMRQHNWAETVEIFGPRVGFNLKDGEGPADLREYFEMAATRMARLDAGLPPDEIAEEAFATLREQVTPYFNQSA
jgi:putative GTP pyrophosphokinase